MRLSIMLKRKGFTLAEVLVTLMVIGVVAALTIPQLIQSTAKNEYKAGLKKSLGALNQALALNIAQNAQEANDATITSSATLADYFGRRMVVIKGATTADFFTADGTQYTFTKPGTACLTTSTDASAAASCTVRVDVNGEKAPNTMSTGTAPANYAYKDRYYFVIRNNAVLPSTGADANFGEAAAVGAITEQ
jgi:prepilin-type N-terminal cleavage/methylation domain-containing protein